MVTSIQVSEELKGALDTYKLSANETYEDVIWSFVEDRRELSEETKRHIEQSRKEISEGKTVSFEKVMRRAGL